MPHHCPTVPPMVSARACASASVDADNEPMATMTRQENGVAFHVSPS